MALLPQEIDGSGPYLWAMSESMLFAACRPSRQNRLE
jgi:hypothetical protein